MNRLPCRAVVMALAIGAVGFKADAETPHRKPVAAAEVRTEILPEAAELARPQGDEAARQARDEWSWDRMVSAHEVHYERASRRARGGNPRPRKNP